MAAKLRARQVASAATAAAAADAQELVDILASGGNLAIVSDPVAGTAKREEAVAAGQEEALGPREDEIYVRCQKGFPPPVHHSHNYCMPSFTSCLSQRALEDSAIEIPSSKREAVLR